MTSKEKKREKSKRYYEKNKDRLKNQRQENIDKIREKDKKYRNENREKINKKAKEYRDKNKEKLKENDRSEYMKKYREKNKEKMKKLNLEWRVKNKDEIQKKRSEQWKNLSDDEKKEINNKKKENYHKNIEKNREKKRNYVNEKMKTDPLFKLKFNIRTLIKNSFLKQKCIKSKKTMKILGCSFDFFKNYIENKFDEHMNWENHGSYWELDHIKPLASAKNKEDIYLLNHYSNFQPLFWKDNLLKSDNF